MVNNEQNQRVKKGYSLIMKKKIYNLIYCLTKRDASPVAVRMMYKPAGK
jgi:hypothetical protein